ncbi:MAG: YdiU family protein [Gammaproteobacteria bacterium]|nr:YdiU family protein [Gammaproteobacteria bacterium]
MQDLPLANAFCDELPGDSEPLNRSRQVHNACYSRVQPQFFADAKLIAVSPEVLALLDLDANVVADPAFTRLLSGSELLPAMQPYACCYGGHQFGHWAGQLGDGRAINLGEVITATSGSQTLQLKGSGPTPYSRNADGYAVLRSSIREFLCSEAMYHLGVPTTRALSLLLSGETVMRDMLYDGHPEREPGAIVCRVAPSFLRFGSYEIFASRGDKARLQQLVDFTIKHHFADLYPAAQREVSQESYLRWFARVCDSTLTLILHWMRVGFVHGVMNTDNMSILGLTIDYGPYGWIDNFDLNWTPNTTDAQFHRYAYGKQAEIALWNLYQLANAVHLLVPAAAELGAILRQTERQYQQLWPAMVATKLGITHYQAADRPLIDALITLLSQSEIDMTLFFRHLGLVTCEGEAVPPPLLAAYYQPLIPEAQTALAAWLQSYRQRLRQQPENDAQRCQRMWQVNPQYVLRNYLAQQAIDLAHQGDYSEIERLLTLLKQPYREQPGMQDYTAKRPDWARQRVGCSMLSCSS